MPATRHISVPDRFDLDATVFSILGPGGNTSRSSGAIHRRATYNDTGPAQVALRRDGSRIVVEAWGPGANVELENAPRLLGSDDRPEVFNPGPGPVYELERRSRGLHLGATGKVFEAIVPTILGQRVTSGQAKRSYHSLVAAFGDPAPGPPGLQMPLRPDQLAALDYEEFHRHGIERSRAVIVREVARRAKRLEEIMQMDRASAYQRLGAIRGVGPWTAGHVMGVAWGDRDAVPIGDYHLPNTVAWLLAGEPRADDDRMLQLLEPYRPERRRVVILIKRSHVAAPKYGPRAAVQDIRSR